MGAILAECYHVRVVGMSKSFPLVANLCSTVVAST